MGSDPGVPGPSDRAKPRPGPKRESAGGAQHRIDVLTAAHRREPLVPPELAPSLKQYMQTLEQHINFPQEESRSNLGDGNCHGSIIPPLNTKWSRKDLDAFYASLNRHSRFRPDLIAEEIGKTTGEVTAYINTCSEGYKERRRLGEQGGTGRGFRSSRFLPAVYKCRAPSAREVSDECIQKEEKMSAELLKLEAEWKRALDRDEVRKKRKQFANDARSDIGARSDRGTGISTMAKAVEEFDFNQVKHDWLSNLTPDKLDLLSRLRAVQENRKVRRVTLAADLCDSREEQQNQNAELFAQLTAMDPKTMTPLQKTHLRHLRSRHAYFKQRRFEEYLKDGMTKEQIEKQGGKEAVRASWEDETADGPGSPSKFRIIMPKSSNKRRRISQEELDHYRQIDDGDVATEYPLDIFDFKFPELNER